MKKYYFKIVTDNGDTIYYQLRYFTPYGNENCYEALRITIDRHSNTLQDMQYFTEDDFNAIQRYFSIINFADFERMQKVTGIFKEGREHFYTLYYGEWKHYYALKRIAQQAVVASNPKDWWEYSQRLTIEEENIDVKEVFISLQKMETQIDNTNNVSLKDVYHEAKHIATYDYSIRRI